MSANRNSSLARESSRDSNQSQDGPSEYSRDRDAQSSTTTSEKVPREETKVYKAISRVHRACNACRKQKARCEGPEDPPCRRCRQVGIECIFEKPLKEPGSSGSGAADAGASSDRIKQLESQMSSMQSMIGELVASIKANTSALGQPVSAASQSVSATNTASPVAPSPATSGSHLDRYSHAQLQHQQQQQQQQQQQHHHQQQQPQQQQQQHRQQQQASAQYYRGNHPYPQDSASNMHRRPNYSHSSSSYGSATSAQPLQQQPQYLLQQPSFHTSFGHPPTAQEDEANQQQQQQQRRREADYSSSRHRGRSPDAQRQPARQVSWTGSTHTSKKDRSNDTSDNQKHRHPSNPSHAGPGVAAPDAPSPGLTAWGAPDTAQYGTQSKQWTAADRVVATAFSPSDGGGTDPGSTGTNRISKVDLGEDTDNKETDISNDQLSAPIEALRGLADAAALAAEEDSEALTSATDSNDEEAKQPEGSQPAGTKRSNQRKETGDGEAGSMPSFQVVDETGQASAVDAASSIGGEGSDIAPSPRKKRRRDTDVTSPGNASGAGPGSSSGRGRMEAPEMASNAPGDLVTIGLVTEADARRLFETFQKGVPKFISIFHLEDEPLTVQEAYEHVRSTSYFLFNVMIAIGAKVECGGRSPSRLYQTCMAQAKRNAKDTLFGPVTGKEAVQAMVLLAAYSENGWLPLGLSIRMAQELGLDRSFQKLMSSLPPGGYVKHPQPPPPPKHLTFYHNSPQSSHYTGSPTDVASIGDSTDGRTANLTPAKGSLEELKDLARGSRLWFFLFLFDHQASYGAGRPAMLSKHYVRNCRAFLNLQYPLTVKTDARFISTLELLIIRETHYDAMAPYDQPVDSRMLGRMKKVTEELNEWHQYWSSDFETRGYGQDSFFQQSLILQCASAELYLTCTALRGIRDANDAETMGPEQKELIIQATRAADTCLSISVNSKEYREMLGWAPHYTHVTAAFACVFLIKIARLFPRQVDTYGIFSNAERLASRLAEVPASKYARVIRILLAQAWKKITDLSPAIGLYAALGAEATRPGAITPAEIKTGGPSDSGITLLYKLLSEYQQGQLSMDVDDAVMPQNEDGNASSNAAGADQSGHSAAAGTGARTPKLSDLNSSSRWLMTGIASPSVGAGGPGAMSPRKFISAQNTSGGQAGSNNHRGSIGGTAMFTSGNANNTNNNNGGDVIQWSTFLAPQTPSAQASGPGGGGSGGGGGDEGFHSLQLPLWMQESTGAFIDFGDEVASAAAAAAAGGNTSSNSNNLHAPMPSDKPSPSGTGAGGGGAGGMRNWGNADQYQSPVPHHPHSSGSQYTSPAYQTPQSSSQQQYGQHHSLHSQQQQQRHGGQGHAHSNSLGSNHNAGAHTPGLTHNMGPTAAAVATSTNFDNVLSDLGLPLDGLDGLFVDLPINAPSAQSNYSV